jgi:hypothetical protein
VKKIDDKPISIHLRRIWDGNIRSRRIGYDNIKMSLNIIKVKVSP